MRMGLMALSLLLAATVAADMLYEGDFSRLPDGPAELDGWNLGGGDYRIDDGWLTVSSAKSNPSATLGTKHDGDGTFRATVRNARKCHWSALLAKGVYRLEVNNQFVRLALHRLEGTEWKLVGSVPGYALYAHNTQEFELRLSFVGNKVSGFLDDKKLIEFEDPADPPTGGAYGIMSGWGTDLAWRDITLSDEPDVSEWPVEATPPDAPEGLVSVTWVRGTRSDNIYSDGETAGLRVKLTTDRETVTQVRLAFRLIDVRQQEVAEKAVPATLVPGAEQELTVEFQAPARGCFKVALWAGTGEQDMGWVEDLGSFTVLAPSVYDRPRNPDSYFGGHMDGINLDWHLQSGRKMGVQWARCHDALQQGWWTRIQPDSPDKWQWPYDDAQIRLDELGFETLGEFLWVPKWATSKPDSPKPRAEPPGDWDAFARYVFTTVEHYRDSISHWEVWNEPHFAGFWRGTPEEYAQLLKAAYREAKRADPDCFVLGGGGVWARRLDWIENMLNAGGGEAMDGFSIHYLEPDIASDLMPRLRQLLNEHGVTGPIWNTEANVPSTSFFNQVRQGRKEPEARYHFRNACYELVRMYMENIANGVERVFYYAQVDPWRYKPFPKPRVFDEAPASGCMWDEGQMLKPFAAAHAALTMAIEGKTFQMRLTRDSLQAFIFADEDSAAAVMYAMFDSFTASAVARMTLPDGLSDDAITIIDFMGNEAPAKVEDGTLTLGASRERVYIVIRGQNAAAALRRLVASAELSGT